jgi:cytochrome c oxidase subunit 4
MSAAHPPAAHLDTHAEGHNHPGVGAYVVIGAILAVITFLEIILYYVVQGLPADHWLHESNATILIMMSGVKFATVVGYFMHLKFDGPMFRYMFGFGLMIAAAVISALLLLFRIYPTPGAGLHH